ncbi:hypothetical protein [Alicyclobacillus fastidiosus]|uniref:Uncharacterized protein n=1 Tax=Alicyclobacillus fastidiosus TaxID=392011 RepID=A0ABV5AIT1_9BACL|nr:hypothetical protein [Alicyclobacillus fastidiosus]WEH07781.1 hypothetical protein PYS47_13490 [Alicyclobacillus fastidiosus]
MQWSEVPEMSPDKFLLLEDLKSNIVNAELHVEEVAVIRPLLKYHCRPDIVFSVERPTLIDNFQYAFAS